MCAKFDDALMSLLMSQPFFGSLLMKLGHVEDKDIPTLCVDGRNVRYNPDFLAQLDLDEVVFSIAHEVMHEAYQHLPRMRYYAATGLGPDGKEMDWDRFNRAADYPINALLAEQGIGKVIDKAKFEICLDLKKYPSTMTPEEVYCKLPPSSGGGGGGGGGKPLDQHDYAAGAESAAPDAITPADVIQAAQQHKAIKGSLPGGMERLLGELQRPSVSPWARLRRFVTRSLPGADATTWRRLQRRLVVRGIGVPGSTKQGVGRVGVVVDTSGSIDQKMLNLFGGHLAAIITDARPEDVRIYWTDARVHRVDSINTPSQLRQVLSKKVPGGGGTDMPTGVRAAEQDKCDVVIVLTDGYTDFCDGAKPLIWAITTKSVSATGNGETIHI